MGITYIHGQVKGPEGKPADVRFLIDSGVTALESVGIMADPASKTLPPTPGHPFEVNVVTAR